MTDAIAQRGGRRLQAIGQAALPRQRHQLTLQQQQPVQAQVVQRLTGDVRGDERMSVPVAAHPGAQAEARQTLGRAQQRRVEAEMLPGLAQPADPAPAARPGNTVYR